MKLLYVLALIIAAPFAYGQYYYLEFSGGTPGDLNQDEAFPVGGGQPTGWTSLVGPSEATPVWSGNQTIPFSFDFNGAAVTQYKVSSTGVLTFTTAAGAVPAEANTAIPTASVPDNSICVWGLMADGTNDNASKKTFGTAPNRQHWIHYSSCTNGTNTWSYWSIVLEESSNNIYIVDQRHSTSGTGSLTAGVQINSTTAISVSGSPNLANQAGSAEGPEDDYYYQFIYGTQAANEVALTAFDLLPYIGQSATNITGTIVNQGSSPITAVDITWDDGTGPYVDNVTGLNIPSNGSYNFTHATVLNPTGGQAYTIDLDVAMTGDVNAANNSMQKSTVSLTSIPTKYVVGEEKTGTWCQWCPRGGVGLSIMESEPRFFGIAVHNADPMEITVYDNNIGTYIPGGYPRGGVDRVDDGNPFNFDAMFANRENEVVPCSVNSVEMIYNDVSGKIEVTTDVEFFGNIAGNYRLLCVITEDDVIGDGSAAWNQVNAYAGGGSGLMTDAVSGFEWSTAGSPVNPNDFGGYDHVAVSLSNNSILGDAGSLPASTVPAGVYNYQFADVDISVLEDIGSAHCVVMVVNTNTGEILNAGGGGWTYVGLQETPNESVLSIYPNPSSGAVNISFEIDHTDQVSVMVTNMLGEVVMNTGESTREAGQQFLSIDGADFPNGVYFVNLRVGDQMITEKLIISK